MDIKDIYEVWDRFEKSSLSELKLSLGGDNLELKKAMEVISTEDKTGKIKQQVITKNDFMEENETNEASSDYKEIKAPFVGTFYRSASPEAKPYVAVGDVVKKGDILGIIEAMKIMNELAAPFSGKIVEIRAEDGKMIEYNQVLFLLEETDV
ncbi:MAG: acetyl-CoA carboxylase biotin carboxyl carrier protein [Catonella sp.]|uniref:acetyl-CoA carboxylase biotin carboxyl carrier protein n=1 Tax=Catonella sp. TaxID=2382125 RepID=UPI003F9F89B6